MKAGCDWEGIDMAFPSRSPFPNDFGGSSFFSHGSLSSHIHLSPARRPDDPGATHPKAREIGRLKDWRRKKTEARQGKGKQPCGETASPHHAQLPSGRRQDRMMWSWQTWPRDRCSSTGFHPSIPCGSSSSQQRVLCSGAVQRNQQRN